MGIWHKLPKKEIWGPSGPEKSDFVKRDVWQIGNLPPESDVRSFWTREYTSRASASSGAPYVPNLNSGRVDIETR